MIKIIALGIIILLILLWISAIPAFVIGFYYYLEGNYVHVEGNFDEQQSNQQTNWNVSEYFDRIEAESLKIAQEKEKQGKYSLILWWGLDGLKMREDGTFEWIRKIDKTKEKSKPIECKKPTFQSQMSVGFNQLDYRNVYYQPQQSIIQHPETEYLEKLLERQNRDRIEELKKKIAGLELQALQNARNQMLIDQLKSTCVEETCKNK